MTSSLGLIFALAILLPGVVSLFAFYGNVETAEVKVQTPPLNSFQSLTIIAVASAMSHAIYVLILLIVTNYPCQVSLPAADPYLLVTSDPKQITKTAFLFIFLGFLYLSLVGYLLGLVVAKCAWDRRDELLFGWLHPIIQAAAPDLNYINAYALSHNREGKDTLGYEGTVLSLQLDSNKAIVGAVLEDVETFYLRMNPRGVERIPGNSAIKTLVLRGDDFQNIALDVVRDETAATTR